MLSDIDIRQALIEEIKKINSKHKNPSFRIIEELTICDGDARVDIAVANGRLCGYEIKSDRDTLERLPHQIECYNTTFDRMTIVVGEKFNEKILAEVPEWWGIKVAYINKFGNVSFKNIRNCKNNSSQEVYRISQLLWKEELLELLRQYNIKGLSNKSRLKMRDIAADTISLKEIRKYTINKLKTREGWRVD